MLQYVTQAMHLMRSEGFFRGAGLALMALLGILLEGRESATVERGPTRRITELFPWALTEVQSDLSGVGISQPIYDLVILCPPPGKGSGGHNTLFRFSKILSKEGIAVAFNFDIELRDLDEKRQSHLEKQVWDWFGIEIAVVSGAGSLLRARSVMATSWVTAYVIKNLHIQTECFYFVQDLESQFYPNGSYRQMADATYDFGFSALSAGPWIAQKLEDRGTEVVDHFVFGSFSHADCPDFQELKDRGAIRIFLYERSNTDRRGLEVAYLALEKLYSRRQDFVVIAAGDDKEVLKGNFPILKLGILSNEDLQRAICSCQVGVALSYTNKSLLPDEILGHGRVLVTNGGPNSTWGMDEFGQQIFIGSDPNSLREALSDALDFAQSGVSTKKRQVSWEQAMGPAAKTLAKKILEQESFRDYEH